MGSDYGYVKDDLAEAKWLIENPHFRERPASVAEFLGPRYLDIDAGVRQSIKDMLVEIIGEEPSAQKPTRFEHAMSTGGIGIGKTTVASIVLPYLCHWCLCLNDPQDFFGLLPGSRIAFMMMSTTESQARQVLFSDIKERLAYSPWFKRFPIDKNFKRQIRFDNNIWIIPGDSRETTFEGYNILGGILDEADSHQVTKEKDYARVGYETITNRISSRFGDKGFLLVIGQMKKTVGFAAEIFEEYSNDPKKYVNRMTIWESRGWEFYRDPDTGKLETFFYDPLRKQVVPSVLASSTEMELMEIPSLYRDQFDANPEKALKDLAGIPPKVTDPFISQTYKIAMCRDRWVEKFGEESPIGPDGQIAGWFKSPNTLPRVAHLDLAFSGNGDACGLAMGHVSHMFDYDGEFKPHIVIDMLWRMKAPKGKELVIADIRRLIYDLRDHFKFNLELVTLDTYQSKDTEQQLRTRKFAVSKVSVDKELLPYYDLREAIYESRLDFPPYLTKLNPSDSDSDLSEILIKELEELRDDGKKVDHPLTGSKDVADALAGVVTTLMGSARYHKNKNTDPVMAPIRDLHTHRIQTDYGQISHPAMNRGVENFLPSNPTPRF